MNSFEIFLIVYVYIYIVFFLFRENIKNLISIIEIHR